MFPVILDSVPNEMGDGRLFQQVRKAKVGPYGTREQYLR